MRELGRGRFEIRQHLGAGGMGIVYRAFDRQRGIEVALKHLHLMDEGGISRLKQEFRALADVAHPNLVPLYDLVATDDEWFFTMELVSGVEFDAYVTGVMARPPAMTESTVPGNSPPAAALASPTEALAPTLAAPSPSTGPITPPKMPPPRATLDGPLGPSEETPALPPCPANLPRLSAALKQLALAVSALHEAGKLHLDLKPSNVLAREDGHIVVLDFGLVRDAAPELSDEDEGKGELISGTPGYMSPQQARGERPTAADDWYAVGVMLYQALTGGLPFTGDVRAVLTLKQLADPEPPSARAKGVPAALDALCLALLRRDPERRAASIDILRALGGAPGGLFAGSRPAQARAPFVGRERELQALREAAGEARRGQTVAVYVRGLSGMGKTVLVKHFVGELRSLRSTLVLTGRCYERELVPFKAVDSVIDALAEHLNRLPAPEVSALLPRDAHALVRLFPALRKTVTALDEGRPLPLAMPDPHELRTRGFRALKELLCLLAARTPLALFIDDLQWGDVDSARLLLELLAPPDPPPLLLLGTYRAEEEATSPFLQEVLGDALGGAVGGALGGAQSSAKAALVRFVDVGTLPLDEVQELARTLLRGPGEPASAYAQIVAREAEGSPFFAGELVRHFLERDQEGMSLGRADDASAEPADTAPLVAPSLLEILGKRLDRLPAQARRALSVIAVAASPIEQGVALRAAGISDGAEAAAALGMLRAGRWIRSRGTDSRDAIETYHDRIREAAADVGAELRRAIHLRLAEELEATGRADVEALASHFGEGGDLEKGGSYAERAAAEAFHSLAFDNAARLYRLALEWRPIDGAHARELSQRLGDALVNAGRGADAAAAYLRAAEDAPSDEARGLERLAAERLLLSGHIDDGMKWLRPLLSAAGLPYPESVLAALAALLLGRARLALRGHGFVRRDAAAVDPSLLRRLDVYYAALRGLLSVDPLRASLYGAEYMRLALESGEPTRIARGLVFEVVTSSMKDARGATRALLNLAEDVRRGVDSPYLDAYLPLAEGFALFATGNYREALAKTMEVETILRERCTDVAWEMGTARMVSSASMLALGDVASLGRRLPVWLKDAEDRNDYYGVTLLYLTHGAGVMVTLAADAPEKARSELRATMSRLPRGGPLVLQQFYALYSEIYVDRYSGNWGEGWRRVREAWPAVQRSPSMRMALFRIQMRMIRGLAALGAGKGAKGWERARLARVAEGDAEAIGSAEPRWARPYSHLIRAGASALRGDEALAISELRRAAAGFKAADMALLLAAVERQLGALLSGSDGSALVSGADAFMTRQTIQDPARFAAMLTPGF